KPSDARVAFLLDLGLKSAPAVEELDTGGKTYAYGLSYEQTDRLESDILVSYASTEEEAQTFLEQSYTQAIPAVEDGAVASVVGDDLIAAMSPPTALSLTWGLQDYVTVLSGAADEVGCVVSSRRGGDLGMAGTAQPSKAPHAPAHPRAVAHRRHRPDPPAPGRTAARPVPARRGSADRDTRCG